MQAVNHLEWLRDYSMKVIVVSFAAAFQNRFLYGFVLPFAAGGTWLASLLVLAKYYEAYGLHTRWWRPWTAATPFRELSPGSGATVLIGRFLFVLGIQGCTGIAVLASPDGAVAVTRNRVRPAARGGGRLRGGGDGGVRGSIPGARPDRDGAGRPRSRIRARRLRQPTAGHLLTPSTSFV